MGQPESIGLEAELASAIDRYSATWQPVDSELYGLCRRRPGQRDFAGVFAKVAIIGRVYEAGISRSSQASGDREAAIARGLIGQGDLIEQVLKELAGCQLDRATAGPDRGAARPGQQRSPAPHGQTWQQSFVSKYLHFHCHFVPVGVTQCNRQRVSRPAVRMQIE